MLLGLRSRYALRMSMAFCGFLCASADCAWLRGCGAVGFCCPAVPAQTKNATATLAIRTAKNLPILGRYSPVSGNPTVLQPVLKKDHDPILAHLNNLLSLLCRSLTDF